MFLLFCQERGIDINKYAFFKTEPVLTAPLESLRIPDPSEDYIDLTYSDHINAGYDKIKVPWKEEEDKKLKDLRDKRNMEWEDIAKLLPGRNAKMCYSRYKRLEYKPREHWKPTEDQLLRQLVSEIGQKWEDIAPFFKNRTLKQVKDHYLNYVKCQANREHWTVEEDMELVELLNLYGRNWKEIEREMPGRSQNQIKNRYFGRIKKLYDKKHGKNLQTLKMAD